MKKVKKRIPKKKISIKLKTYSWSDAIDELRKLVKTKLPKLFCNVIDSEAFYTAEDYLMETDEFHPMDTERELEYALDHNDHCDIDEALMDCFYD